MEFFINNAKDKSVVLGMNQSKLDFLKFAIGVGRSDIVAVLVKNGVAFTQYHLEHLRYDWDKMFKAETYLARFPSLRCEKDEMLRIMWELLIAQGFSVERIYSTAITYYDGIEHCRQSSTQSQQAFIYALRNKLFDEEVLDSSFSGLTSQGAIDFALLGKKVLDSLDTDLVHTQPKTQRIVPLVFAMFEDTTYEVLEYALFLGLHKGRKNDRGEDFESFLQRTIEEYIILTTKGNAYGTIFVEDEEALAYFQALQRFMQDLESIKKGEVIQVDNETLKILVRIEEIPLSQLDTSK